MSDAPDAAGHKRPEAGTTPQWMEDQVQQYLRSGDHDMMFAGWPGMPARRRRPAVEAGRGPVRGATNVVPVVLGRIAR